MKPFLLSILLTTILFAQPNDPYKKVKTFTLKDVKTVTINEDSVWIKVDVKYPVTGYAKLDDKTKEYIDMMYFQTKEDCSFLKENKERPDISGMLSMDFQLIPKGKDFLNVDFTGYIYTGGAHGMPIKSTYLYDIKKDKLLELHDLFKPEGGYLEIASKYCKKELLKYFKKNKYNVADWFNDGVAPEETNYFTFLLKDEGIYFYFGPYQVAPYAYGVFWVLVPHKQFTKLYLKEYSFK